VPGEAPGGADPGLFCWVDTDVRAELAGDDMLGELAVLGSRLKLESDMSPSLLVTEGRKFSAAGEVDMP
jgi:hypothetical protein